MGVKIFDQYTYLHFATGIIAYFWNIPILLWFVMHTIFEVIENTKIGMQFINNFSIWPGGKPYADNTINIIGDTIGSMLGWWSAYALDHIGKKKKWYM